MKDSSGMEMKEKLSRIPTCSVQQLARFIGSRIHPFISNYTMLIGSGCSVTSRIRSGEQLINEWKKQVYLEATNDYDSNDIEEKIEQYFSLNCPSWFKTDKPYQTLFEQLYPIKELRRKFVEKEIENEKVFPGIGYAELVHLAKKHYIDTFFTTNFDDLINEAFYIYGGRSSFRPIVCSHEASTDSISITQQRPKIIKLHGDYLFENLRTTDDDTSTLVSNMAQKFSEFAKEKGLIVVGYSGNDDSIMNVIRDIAVEDSHINFKAGVFWCVRNGSTPNDKVIDLLYNINQKERRAWIVYIDGFDELLCELTHFLRIEGEEEFPGFFLFSGADNDSDVSKFYCENEYYESTKSKYLKNKYKAILNSFKPQSEDKRGAEENENEDSSFKGVRKAQDKKYTRINELIESKRFDEATTEIARIIGNEQDRNERYELNQLLAYVYSKCNHNVKAISLLENLINERPFDTQNYYNLSILKSKLSEKIDIINSGLMNEPASLTLIARKGELLLHSYESLIDFPLEKEHEIEDVLRKGIDLSSGIDNPCWQKLFSYYYRKAKKDNDYSNCSSLLKSYKERFPYDYRVVSLDAKVMRSQKESLDPVIEYLRLKNNKNNPDKELFDSLIAETCFENKDISEVLRYLKTRYDFRIVSSVIEKASFLYKYLRYPEKAIELIKAYLEKNNSDRVEEYLVNLLLLLGRAEDAENLIDQYTLPRKQFEGNIAESRGDWEQVARIEKKKLDESPYDEHCIMGYTHALLWLGRFNEVKTILQEKLKLSNFSNKRLLINYTIARRETREAPIKNSEVTRLSTSDEDSLENVALLLIRSKNERDENKQKAKEMLSRLILKDYSDYDYSRKMYVFSRYLNTMDWESIMSDILPSVEIDDEEWSEIKQTIL